MRNKAIGGKEMFDVNAMFKLSYGLFVLTVKDEGKDNGCIINTVMQVTDTPMQICVTVNKQNYTTELLEKTGVLNVSILSEAAKFSVFESFGFQSGRDADKFAGFDTVARSENGLLYLTEMSNAYLSAKVVNKLDLGTHIQFIAEVTDGQVLSDTPSVTYAYYFANIKPKPQPAKKKGYVCKICGYVYEGDPLPDDFICPWCKHGASDFEVLE